MKKHLKNVIVLILLIAIIPNIAYAKENEIVEYSDEYKQYLELSQEEKNNIIPPRMYNIESSDLTCNMFCATSNNYYNLQDIIPENVVVRNQMQTKCCWAFSALASLESTLGMQNYKNQKYAKFYDFSERHLDYVTTRQFLNEQINEKGFNRVLGSGGNANLAVSCMINGTGPISEEQMPFENNENLIDISQIQNKTVTAEILDTVDFPSSYNGSYVDKNKIKEQIKEHLQNYGAVMASIYGAKTNSPYYNPQTGAIYCDSKANCPVNHQVVIIGWDDDYSLQNFNELHRPKNNGAWIIKNSWGTSYGNDGIMYLSYEDINAYYWTAGIQNALDYVSYDNIYQYNQYCYNYTARFLKPKIYLATQFTKQTSDIEYLTKVSVYSPATYSYKVYVNVNGTSRTKESFKEVNLKDGEYEIVSAGYHTFEFKEPIKIESEDFVVMLEVENLEGLNEAYYAIEAQSQYFPLTKYSTIAQNKCFVTIESKLNDNKWYDLSDVETLGVACNSTIKAFTITKDDYLLGDVSGDGKITTKDLNMLYAYVNGTLKLTDEEFKRGELTGDGFITAKDLNRLYAHLNGTKPLN